MEEKEKKPLDQRVVDWLNTIKPYGPLAAMFAEDIRIRMFGRRKKDDDSEEEQKL